MTDMTAIAAAGYLYTTSSMILCYAILWLIGLVLSQFSMGGDTMYI